MEKQNKKIEKNKGKVLSTAQYLRPPHNGGTKIDFPAPTLDEGIITTKIKNSRCGKMNVKNFFERKIAKLFGAAFVFLLLGISIIMAGTVTVEDGKLIVSDNLDVDQKVLYVDSTNNKVGIGVAAPTVKLDVDGGIKVSSGNDICIDEGNCLSSAGGGDIYWSDLTDETTMNLPDPFVMDANDLAICDGDCGNQDIATGAGDLYVEDDLEVDGRFRLPQGEPTSPQIGDMWIDLS